MMGEGGEGEFQMQVIFVAAAGYDALTWICSVSV